MATNPTHASQGQLERAIMRAHSHDMYFIGTGRRRTDGARLFVVSSMSDPIRGHLVGVVEPHRQCDCMAAQCGHLYQHRAIVHERLLAERAASQAIGSGAAETNTVCAIRDYSHRVYTGYGHPAPVAAPLQHVEVIVDKA